MKRILHLWTKLRNTDGFFSLTAITTSWSIEFQALRPLRKLWISFFRSGRLWPLLKMQTLDQDPFLLRFYHVSPSAESCLKLSHLFFIYYGVELHIQGLQYQYVHGGRAPCGEGGAHSPGGSRDVPSPCGSGGALAVAQKTTKRWRREAICSF